MKFDDVFEDKTKYGTKIKSDEYQAEGKNVIVDQGQSLIAGYTDRQSGLFEDVPAIVFGDHTRIVKYIDRPFFLGADGVKVLKCKLPNANCKYLYYALLCARIPSTGYNRHFKWLKELDINYPTPEFQKAIATRLDEVNAIISLRKRQLAKFDELVKARFVEMFGEPIANPKNWEVKPLKELSVLITNGTTPKGGSENYVSSGIIFLRSQNVWRNRVELDDVVYIDEATHNCMKKSSLHHKDILITKTGRINTENSSLGRAALYLGEDDQANINGHVYLVRLNGTVVPEYVITILTGEAYRRYIRKVCVGGIDKRQINIDHVEGFPIILAPYKMQEKFADFVALVDKSKAVVYRTIIIVGKVRCPL